MHGGENPVLLRGCGSPRDAAGSVQPRLAGLRAGEARGKQVQGSFTDRVTLLLCIKRAQSLAVGQKCFPGLWERSPVPAVCCHGGCTCSPWPALRLGRAQLRNLGGVSARRAMPRASCTRSVRKSIKMRPNGTSSVMDLPTSQQEAIALVWMKEELS